MRKRSIKVQLWLNEKEFETLNNRVKKSGLNRESYLRHLINGLVPTDVPPPDFYNMMRELHAIGRNLNQISRKANVLDVIDVKSYFENVDRLTKATIDIMGAVMLPRKVDFRCEVCSI